MLIECDADTYLSYIKDDPVRKGLFDDESVRFKGNFRVFADIDKSGFDTVVNAIVCVVITPTVPQSEQTLRFIQEVGEQLNDEWEKFERELLEKSFGLVLCPYSLWSYNKGAGRRLINNLLEAVPVMYPNVQGLITMSPKTDMAMKFHLGNGAEIMGVNPETINYVYDLSDNEVRVH